MPERHWKVAERLEDPMSFPRESASICSKKRLISRHFHLPHNLSDSHPSFLAALTKDNCTFLMTTAIERHAAFVVTLLNPSDRFANTLETGGPQSKQHQAEGQETSRQ